MKRTQRGVTFIGVVVIGAIVAVLGTVAAQLVPTLIDHRLPIERLRLPRHHQG